MSSYILLFLFSFVAARAIRDNDNQHLDARQQDLPTIELPYGTWQAASYNEEEDIYQFTNIRFAAPPVGDLRWAKPATPTPNSTLQTGEVGGTCYQVLPPQILDLAGALGGAVLGSGDNENEFSGILTWLTTTALPFVTSGITTLLYDNPLLAQLFGDIVTSIDIGSIEGGSPDSEDCLFLDLVVPGKAIRKEQTLPVVNYIYGGAYALGSKDPIYNGYGLVRESNGSIIYAVGNYRLGAYGFLGGETVANDPTAVANAGFWDQIAVLEWIQNYISLVNGDPSNVSLWGESAGAGSVMHHLVAFGGKQPGPPLFNKAFVQSPWNVVQYNTKGRTENQYQDLLSYAGCSDLACLRQLDVSALNKAAYQVAANDLPEHFGFGASVDGTLVQQLPPLEFAAGHIVPGVESVIVTHCIDEASAFVPNYLENNMTAMAAEVDSLYDSVDVQNEILQFYPPSNASNPVYTTEQGRIVDYMAYSYFVCHVRYIAQAFPNASWVGQWSRGTGKHGADISALFHNASTPDDFDSGYQNYLISHAVTGDPNTLQTFNGTINWPKPTIGDNIANVINIGADGYSIITDDELSAEQCDFWLKTWQQATAEDA